MVQISYVGPADPLGSLVEAVVTGGDQARETLVDLHLHGDEIDEDVALLAGTYPTATDFFLASVAPHAARRSAP